MHAGTSSKQALRAVYWPRSHGKLSPNAVPPMTIIIISWSTTFPYFENKGRGFFYNHFFLFGFITSCNISFSPHPDLFFE